MRATAPKISVTAHVRIEYSTVWRFVSRSPRTTGIIGMFALR